MKKNYYIFISLIMIIGIASTIQATHEAWRFVKNETSEPIKATLSYQVKKQSGHRKQGTERQTIKESNTLTINPGKAEKFVLEYSSGPNARFLGVTQIKIMHGDQTTKTFDVKDSEIFKNRHVTVYTSSKMFPTAREVVHGSNNEIKIRAGK